MPNSSDARRGSRTWWVGLLSLVVCLGAGSGGLHAQERVTAISAVLDRAGESVARIDARDQTNACNAGDAKIRYLIEELITQRFESAQLSIKLAEARAEAAEFKEVFSPTGSAAGCLDGRPGERPSPGCLFMVREQGFAAPAGDGAG